MNGQEKDDEIAQGIYTARFWEYDSRLGRRWNLDPKPNATESSYSCFSNNPIWKNDVNGDTTYIYTTSGGYKGVILDKLKTNEIVLMTDLNANAIMGLQGGKYSEEIVANVARNPIFADARFTENSFKNLQKHSTTSQIENSGLLYTDNDTKEVKVDECIDCRADAKNSILGGESNIRPLAALEKKTSLKGKIIGSWHTHPGTDTEPSTEDYQHGGLVNALEKGGIGIVVGTNKNTLYPLANQKTGKSPTVNTKAKTDGVVNSIDQHPTFDKKISPVK